MTHPSFRPRLARLVLVSALAVPMAAVAQTPAAAPAKPVSAAKAMAPKGLPPVLDRELFFGNPEIAGAQLSPDGKWTAFLKPWKETRNVWVKKTGDPYDKAHLVTAEPKRPVAGFFWSRDSKYILFVKDKDGDENFNVWAVDPAAKPEAGKDAPTARNLTDAKSVQAQIYDVPKTDPDIVFVGLNDRDAAWHDLYRVKISTGERTLLRKNTEKIVGWDFDLAGQLRLAARIADNGDTEVLRVDPEGFTKIYSCSVFESCNTVRFHKDGKRVYMQSSKGEPDLTRLLLFDPATGKEEAVETDPKGRVDFGSAIFSEATDELAATSYEDEKTRIYFRDKDWEADYRLLEKKLPNREVIPAGATADDRLWMVTAYSDVDPGTRYLFDRKTKKLSVEYVSRERLPREHMAAMKPISYPSSDGLMIPAYLTVPKGIPAKNLPLVVFPHGGPWARDGWGFNNNAQFLANRGYAVLSPNFRGSTGYGKKFLNAGNKQWGLKMQDDLTWGVKYLVKEGIADPKKVAIMGGSYGGYATLAGVAFTPDVYAAGVSIVGPSNLLTLLETIPPYWEAIRIIFHERMGNPNTPEGKKQLEAPVAAQLRHEDQDPAPRHPGGERPAREEGRVGPDRHRPARPRLPGGVHLRPGRGARLPPPRQQHGRHGHLRGVPGQAPRRPVPGGRDARGRRPPQGDHGRPEDGRPREEGRHGRRRRAEAGRRPRGRDVHLRRHDRRGPPDDADLLDARRQGGGEHLGRHRHDEDADGRGRGHDDGREGDARPGEADDQAGPGHDRARLRRRQGDRDDGDGSRAEAGLRRPRRPALRRRERGRRLGRLPAARRGLPGDVPELRRPEAEARAQAGEGDRRRGGQGRRGDVPGLEGRADVGRGRARRDDALGRQGDPEGREDVDDAAADGRRGRHVRAPAVGIRLRAGGGDPAGRRPFFVFPLARGPPAPVSSGRRPP